MTAQRLLAVMTLIAVVGDSLLHPFYPQYFADVLHVTDPLHVSYYIAAFSFTVLACFPLWALVSRVIETRRLLLVTQLAAGLLSLCCAQISSLFWFWAASLTMFAFKASYLLIYPYLMTFERREQHLSTIGMLAFVVYFGHIAAGLLGGALFEWVHPRALFTIMALADLLQILLCVYMLRSPLFASPLAEPSEERPSAPPRGFLLKLGSVMFLMYFSAYLSEPFFGEYWEEISRLDNRAITGLVFAIPGIAALLGLMHNARSEQDAANGYTGILPALALTVVSLVLQASHLLPLVLIGRFSYGLGLFYTMVRLDSLLFSFSTPDSYAVDFSKANLFQGLGVLFASLTAGTIVVGLGARATFLVAAFVFTGAALAYGLLLRKYVPGGEHEREGESVTRDELAA